MTLSHGQLVFEYLAKGAQLREQAVAEEQVCAVVRSLRLAGAEGISCWCTGAARAGTMSPRRTSRPPPRGIRGDYTAKDFRTWHATVLAAVGLAVSESAAGHEAARTRAIARVVREVAGYLGNTPAVARASYIDPRVIDLYEKGRTIASALGELGKDCDSVISRPRMMRRRPL